MAPGVKSENKPDGKLPETIREYMILMRRNKDPKLFFYKSSNMYEPYSSKCGAVDNRQPIIMNDRELDNLKSKNMDGYDKYKENIVKWGSDKSNLKL